MAPSVLPGHLAQGDDLDDGLDLDSGLLARSDAEEELDVEGNADRPSGEVDAEVDADARGAVYEEADDGSPRPEARAGKGKKRKEREAEVSSRSVKKVGAMGAPQSQRELKRHPGRLVDAARGRPGSARRRRPRRVLPSVGDADVRQGFGHGAGRYSVAWWVRFGRGVIAGELTRARAASAVLSTANYSSPRDLDHYADFVTTRACPARLSPFTLIPFQSHQNSPPCPKSCASPGPPPS